MDDATLDLTLAAWGITPQHPSYAAIKASLQQQARNLSSQQGVQFGEEQRQFNEQQQRAKESAANQRKQIDNQYEIAKFGVRNDEERTKLDRWKAEQDTRLREAELAISQGNLQVAQERLGIERGAQGLGLIKTMVDLNSQVRNWAKALDWRRGLRDNPNTPVFLQNLLANSGASGPGAPTSAPTMTAPIGLPEQNSLAAMLGDLGLGQPGTAPGTGVPAHPPAATTGTAAKADPTPAQVGIQAMAKAYTPSATDGHDVKDTAFLNGIAALAAQGSGKSANRVGQLDEDEQQALAGGLDRLGIGGDWWLRDSERKRYGGGTSSGLAA